LREVGYRLKETTLGSGAEDDHEHERKQLRMEGEHLSLVSLSSRYLLIATESSFFFLIKCKNIIDQKGAGDQQYKEKGTKSLDQIKSKTSVLNRRQREQTPLYKP